VLTPRFPATNFQGAYVVSAVAVQAVRITNREWLGSGCL